MDKLHNKRVCVTGGAGFIGSHLCQRLLDEGAVVTVVDDFSVGTPANIESIKDKVTVHRADIADREAIREVISGSQIVYHLAALANMRACADNFDLAFKTNITGTYNVLSCCKGVERVIFPSSITTYGFSERIPINETCETRQNDPYSTSKVTGEHFVRVFAERLGFTYTITRKCNSYGPRQTLDYLMPTIIHQGLTRGIIEVWDPRPIRDYIFVSDTVEALLLMAISDGTRNELVNLGTGTGWSVGDAAQQVAELLGVRWRDVNKRQPVASKLIGDSYKLRSLTGWAPRTSFRDGIIKTIDYWRSILGRQSPEATRK